ncbi:DUF255 domain-containing protein [Dyadobacter sp. CY323]|uniref:DUF255 domain-containing protein n=1 Tax=Dyadobacter sp. CY323 TaxID=2907302 RepID=UPI001F203121|nr:DUF255 domain-containing protein [Dyadobacter sp. CY323]MCE6991728.1 DUF255 domain-containing protein [Dyadobacter sp. CY323]
MKTLLSICLCIFSLCSFAQITFVDSKTSWTELSKKAKEENKIVFIHLENSKCDQCNEVATQGFSSPILKEKFDKHFVSVRCNVDTENGADLQKRFEVNSSLISLFIDPSGNILARYNGSTSYSKLYLDQAGLALSRVGSKHVNEYIKEYKAGEKSAAFLKEYLGKLRESQLSLDNVLDEYVDGLPDDSLNNFNTIRFIYQQGPSLDSKAYKRIRSLTKPRLIDSMYQSVPLAEAISINNGIINASMRNAVMKRNESLAQAVSGFTMGTYGADRAKGVVESVKMMLNYYYAVRDTTKYLATASEFIERNYMNVSIDFLKKIDSLEVVKMMPKDPIPKNGVTVRSFGVQSPSQFYHIELNNRAWHFYEMAATKTDLEKALSWSKLAIDWSSKLVRNVNDSKINGNPRYKDTYAHLLYKLDRRDEAIEWQTKAVEEEKAMGRTSGSLETTLIKMKAGTL